MICEKRGILHRDECAAAVHCPSAQSLAILQPVKSLSVVLRHPLSGNEFSLVKNRSHNVYYFFLKHFSGPESGILEFDWLLTRVPPVQFFPIRTGFVMDH